VLAAFCVGLNTSQRFGELLLCDEVGAALLRAWKVINGDWSQHMLDAVEPLCVDVVLGCGLMLAASSVVRIIREFTVTLPAPRARLSEGLAMVSCKGLKQ